MSRKPKGIDIPWFLIAFLFLSGAWPIGLFLLVLRSLDDPYHSFLDELHEPYKNQCVDEIEEGMKH